MNIEILLGKTITQIINGNNVELIFHTSDHKIYSMIHHQDCCEDVTLIDTCGDLNDLLHTPIIQATETTNEITPVDIQVKNALQHGTDEDPYNESITWTFYKLDTIKGGVTLRWLGQSNGYYSEDMDFNEIDKMPIIMDDMDVTYYK
tara:strand:- start:1100 stop:1540 length:441 start_codon:yes stop_codon:yes gene_type:complete